MNLADVAPVEQTSLISAGLPMSEPALGSVDPWLALHEAMLEIQRAALDIQGIAIATSDVELKRAGVEIQEGATRILKAGLRVQEQALFNPIATTAASSAQDHLLRGSQLLAQGKAADAIPYLRSAAAENAHVPEVHKLLGDALLKIGENEKASEAYHSAIALRSDFPEADNNLAISRMGCFDYLSARAVLMRMLERDHGLPQSMRDAFRPQAQPVWPAHLAFPTASPFKLRHHAAQIRHLLNAKAIDSSFEALARQYDTLLQELSSLPNRIPYTRLTDEQFASFGGYYDKVLFYADTPPLDGPALNPDLDWPSIEREYIATRSLYFDGLLTADALARLHEFFLTSTVFFRHSEAGFVGSYVTDGFNCSLIFQIIAELHARLPNVLANRPLNNMWCYRYGPAGHGVRPHNGDGSVTINFWIAPDEGNLTPAGGGMVMYDKEHPAEWDWLEVNMYKDDPAIQAKIANYLRDAHSNTIPYRCNRAVLFHSTLFHETDPFRFKEGYLDSRMNITMLMGTRGQESAALK